MGDNGFPHLTYLYYNIFKSKSTFTSVDVFSSLEVDRGICTLFVCYILFVIKLQITQTVTARYSSTCLAVYNEKTKYSSLDFIHILLIYIQKPLQRFTLNVQHTE